MSLRERDQALNRNFKLFSAAKIAKLILVTLFLSTLQATPAPANENYVACVNKNSGVIRMLIKGGCNKKQETKIKWNSNGKDGINGRNGNTVLYGTADPTSIIGVDGDFYINSSTNKIFGPKAKEWPVGISLVGPQGPGGAGSQGPAGVSGAATQVLWFTPRDLLATPAVGDDSAVVALADIIQNQHKTEVLDIQAGKTRIINRAIPKGWSAITSLTWRIYWISESSNTRTVTFDLQQNYLREGSLGVNQNTRWAVPDPGGTDLISKPATEPNVVSVHTFTSPVSIFPTNVTPREGDLLTFSLYRRTVGNDANAYTGKVYILGLSIQANF